MQLHDRELQAPYEVGQWAVEGRDMDDWMVVDCGNVLVSIFEEGGSLLLTIGAWE